MTTCLSTFAGIAKLLRHPRGDTCLQPLDNAKYGHHSLESYEPPLELPFQCQEDTDWQGFEGEWFYGGGQKYELIASDAGYLYTEVIDGVHMQGQLTKQGDWYLGGIFHGSEPAGFIRLRRSGNCIASNSRSRHQDDWGVNMLGSKQDDSFTPKEREVLNRECWMVDDAESVEEESCEESSECTSEGDVLDELMLEAQLLVDHAFDKVMHTHFQEELAYERQLMLRAFSAWDFVVSHRECQAFCALRQETDQNVDKDADVVAAHDVIDKIEDACGYFGGKASRDSHEVIEPTSPCIELDVKDEK